MQHRDALRLLVEQAGAQDIREEVVVAVPLAPVVERDHEQVLPVEDLQRGPAAVLTRDGVAERALSRARTDVSSRNRRTALGLALQDLLDEVVDDVAVVARELLDEPADVVATLQREGGELQGGDPAFRSPFQRSDVAGRQVEPIAS